MLEILIFQLPVLTGRNGDLLSRSCSTYRFGSHQPSLTGHLYWLESPHHLASYILDARLEFVGGWVRCTDFLAEIDDTSSHPHLRQSQTRLSGRT